ncbi:tripartite tricarboxylate transporter TctB family protein [Pseudothauera rhizosphaerae]|uniref:Tripartite tricarboxylate transporter TctB family protein n=1 Tax=Pseudothauera rhizosphaerae TaxID=2565932 RepID=A0A4S4AYN2_9RHOO|nr:tripartite tricarboxylate transporter TctB family protein [Pseudothauera rhizosphaerae]THF65248.1 tripartite tricarboxylate transporter TctB family protein [Pseudothauera rhizosphaerae]
MKLRILNRRDAFAGALFLSFGLAAGFVSSSYPLGNAMRMGAGYFPLLLGAVLVLLGSAILWRSLRLYGERVPDEEAPALRPAACVGAAVVAFALLVPQLGLLIATVVLTLVSGLARSDLHVRELAVLSAVLAAFGVAVFSYGLGLPLPVLPA